MSRLGGRYAWAVFAISFGLMLSDYMARQVVNALFPLLKAEWALTDGALGTIGGITPLLVGVLAVPLSLAADRFGRVRSMLAMAVLWSLATLGCALAVGYGQMLVARLLVGVGEAAYGSVGIAVILGLFPRHQRAGLTGAFLAGGPIGSVLGMAVGAHIASQWGWRPAFAVIGLFGLALCGLYAAAVRERRLPPDVTAHGRFTLRSLLPTLFGSRALVMVYFGSGLQLFVMAAMLGWLPSFLNRAYRMETARAGTVAAGLILLSALGMTLCGVAADRLARQRPDHRWTIAGACSLVSVAALAGAFQLPPGAVQLALIGLGMTLVAGTSGPAGAIAAELTPPSLHGTVLATLAVANNLLGLAPGAILTGLLSDRLGLQGALQVVPLGGLAAGLAFTLGRVCCQRGAQPNSADQA